ATLSMACPFSRHSPYDACERKTRCFCFYSSLSRMVPMSESAAASLDVIGGSRRDILDVLKKRGEASADELASELRMTVSGVRQQLAALGGDGLVTHRRVKGGPGRPRHLFLLSPAAESFFPKTYSELTNELLGYIEDEEPEMVERIFEKR